MVAKVLQQIANGNEFDSDHFLCPLNPMIRDHHARLVAFLSGLVETEEQPVLVEKAFNSGAVRQLMLRVPVYADDALMNLEFGPNAMVFGSSNMSALRFRLLFRFSLKRQPQFLADEEQDESESSAGEDSLEGTDSGSGTSAPSERGGFKKSLDSGSVVASPPRKGSGVKGPVNKVFESEAVVNEKLTPSQVGLVTR
jgi:hypothetical protein